MGQLYCKSLKLSLAEAESGKIYLTQCLIFCHLLYAALPHLVRNLRLVPFSVVSSDVKINRHRKKYLYLRYKRQDDIQRNKIIYKKIYKDEVIQRKITKKDYAKEQDNIQKNKIHVPVIYPRPFLLFALISHHDIDLLPQTKLLVF